VSDLLVDHFRLKAQPFGKQLPDVDLWLDPSRKLAVERLVGAVTNRQHALVRGDPGVGKNCLVRAMRARLSPNQFRIVYVANVTVGRRDFYRQLSLALGLEPRGTAAAVFEAIQREARASWTEHRIHPVLIIDEAHLMPESTLGHLHVLANFDMDSSPLLSLILVGLPELHDRLRLGVHRSLLTRIPTLVDIQPTTPDDTAAYVTARLETVGARPGIFASDALIAIHELAASGHEGCGAIAEGAMRVAMGKNEQQVDRFAVRVAFKGTPLA